MGATTGWKSAASGMLAVACTHAPVPADVPAAIPTAPLAAPASPGVPLAQLEEIFWTCDYLATTRGVDATPISHCTAATRELRRVKFDGSFHRLLAWWRENKPAVHERLRAERNDPL